MKKYISSKVLSLCLVFALILVSMNCNVYAAGEKITNEEKESNDTWDTANVISLGEPINGNISNNYDTDCFSYIPDERKDMNILFISSDAADNKSVHLCIVDRDDRDVIDCVTTSNYYQKDFIFEPDHEYIFIVNSQQADSNYQLAIYGDRIEEQVYIINKEFEFNGNADCANILRAPGAQVFGKFTNYSDDDFFCFTSYESGPATFEFHPYVCGSYFIFLYDEINQRYIYDGTISVNGESFEIPYDAINGGLYYVCIAPNDSDTHNVKYYIQNRFD